MKKTNWLNSWIQEKINQGMKPDMIKHILEKSGRDSDLVDKFLNSKKKSTASKTSIVQQKIKSETRDLKTLGTEINERKWIKN